VIIGIVAIAKNLAIGRGGKLPWHSSADLKFFKETTTGHTVVMGSKTWASIGRPLPDRTNVVLSRNRQLELPSGVRLAGNKDEILALPGDIFIIGGREIFSLYADNIDRWIVTEVPLAVDDADTFMPTDFVDGFSVESTRDLGEGLVVKTYVREDQN
jgi:dihydrofolate reductase